MMQAMVWTQARQPDSSRQRDQQRRTVRVLLSAEQVLRDSSLIEGVLDAVFYRLPTTTVVLCVRRPVQEARS